MKVLHLLQSNRFSGAENVVCQIIGMFSNTPDVEMAYCSRDGQIRDALDERGIKFLPISALNVSEVMRVIKEFRPDVIHAHDMRAAFIGALAGGKIKLISHIHNNNFDSRGVSLKSILFLLAGFKSKHIFWVSNGSCEGYCFHSLFKKKSQVLYNILDIDALYEKAETDIENYNYDIVYLGRLNEIKNPLRMIRIIAEVAKQKEDLKVAVVGSGELEEECKALSKQLGLEDKVEFLGYKSNPLKIVKSSKVMIMTSLTEGTPMSALESFALGTPIVSTPVGGMCELIENGVNGFLTEDDSVMVEQLLKLITNSEYRFNCSQNAANKCKELCDVGRYKTRILKSSSNIN